MKQTILLLILACLFVAARAADTKAALAPSKVEGSNAAKTPAAPKLKQWLYVLRLIPRLHDDKAWTEADGKAGSAHFAHLQAATKSGQVVLAGRTMESGDKTMGLVIFEAAAEPAARTFMQSDPAVVLGIMTATLHPYMIALQRKPEGAAVK